MAALLAQPTEGPIATMAGGGLNVAVVTTFLLRTHPNMFPSKMIELISSSINTVAR